MCTWTFRSPCRITLNAIHVIWFTNFFKLTLIKVFFIKVLLWWQGPLGGSLCLVNHWINFDVTSCHIIFKNKVSALRGGGGGGVGFRYKSCHSLPSSEIYSCGKTFTFWQLNQQSLVVTTGFCRIRLLRVYIQNVSTLSLLSIQLQSVSCCAVWCLKSEMPTEDPFPCLSVRTKVSPSRCYPIDVTDQTASLSAVQPMFSPVYIYYNIPTHSQSTPYFWVSVQLRSVCDREDLILLAISLPFPKLEGERTWTDVVCV